MKSILVIFLCFLSISSYASIDLICNDQNSHAVYQLQIEKVLKIIPLIKDAGVLSENETTLKFNEGENLFEGKNENRKIIVVEINLEQVKNLTLNQIISADVTYSDKNLNLLDQKTELLCSLK